MMQFRILDQIYPFMGNVSVSATSEDSEFPASNLTRSFRSKVWRSSGYFEITAGNCNIDFQEVLSGPVLTAAIAIGSYGPDDLAAAITAALTAAGTVAYIALLSGTTGLWSISSAGSFLSLLWTSGPSTASSAASTLGFSPLSDLTGATSYAGASIAIHSYEAAVFDLGTRSPVDSACILFDPSSPINLSASAELRIQAGPTLNWATAAIDQVVTIDELYSAATLFFSTSQNYRYWRLKITDPGNANLYIEIPKVILSSATQLIRLPDSTVVLNYSDTSKTARTDYGHEYIDSYPIMKQLVVTYAGLPYADVQTLSQVFQRVGSSRPMVVVADPLGIVFDQNHFLIYGKIANPLAITGVLIPTMASGFTVNEANG